jgi:hypothetical protein
MWLATVTLESDSYKYPDNDAEKNERKNADRMAALSAILKTIAENNVGEGIVIFPGGYFHSGTDDVNTFSPSLVYQISTLLEQYSATIIVVIGIDGKVILTKGATYRYDANQIALVVSSQGIDAGAKKFFPTDPIEADVVDLAENYLSEEMFWTHRYSRIFSLANRSFYVAVCNDIKGLGIHPKPEGVDAILNCVHGCYNREDHIKDKAPQCNYFVRRNFAGASQQWRCPVFGAVVFFKRRIAEKWRTGILYHTWDKMLIQCETDENALAPIRSDRITKFGSDLPQVDIYDLNSVFSSTPVYRDRSISHSPARSTQHTAPINNREYEDAARLFDHALARLSLIFGNSGFIQETKITFRGKNTLGYTRSDELDMIIIFKPGRRKSTGIKFRVYPFVLAGHLNCQKLEQVEEYLPLGSESLKQSSSKPKWDIFHEGRFTSTEDIDTFLDALDDR